MNEDLMENGSYALIVVDMQNVSLPTEFYSVYNMLDAVQNTRKVIEACRQAGIPVIYTRQTHLPSGFNASYMEPKDESGCPLAYVKGSWGWEIVDELAPASDEVVVNKSRWSAFFCTDMELILRGLGARRLIFCGVTTDACLQASVCDAFYRDYPVTVIKDACGAYNQACHESAILNLANWVYGITIYEADEFVKRLQGQPHKVTQCEQPNQFAYSVDDLHSLYEAV